MNYQPGAVPDKFNVQFLTEELHRIADALRGLTVETLQFVPLYTTAEKPRFGMTRYSIAGVLGPYEGLYTYTSGGEWRFIPEQISRTKITADSVTLSAGTSSSTVSDLQSSNDGNVYTITEAAATPGISFIVDFIDVTAFSRVNCLAAYDETGTASHVVEVELYNWSSAAWDHFDSITDGVSNSGTAFKNGSFFVPDYTDYVGTGANEGKVRVRHNHPQAGNPSHKLYVDTVALYW